MKPFGLFLSLFTLHCFLFGQANEALLPTSYPQADSLRLLLSTTEDQEKKWTYLRELALFFTDNHPDSGLYYSVQTLEFAQSNLPEKLASSYVVLGNYYTENKQYEEALSNLTQAIELADQTNCLLCKLEAYNELFLISYDKLEFDKALSYLRKNYETSVLLNDSLQMSRALTNIGLVFSQIPQNDSAEVYITRALNIAHAIQYDRIIRFCYNNLAIIHQNKGEYQLMKADLKKAVEYSRKGNDKEMLATTLFNLGESYIQLNDLDSGMFFLDQARDLFLELRRPDLMTYYYDDLAEVSSRKGDYKKAFEVYKQFKQLSDSIQSALYSTNLIEAETRFETKEKEAELIKKELALQKEETLRNRLILFGSLILLLVVGLFQFFRYKDRLKKQQVELSARMERAEAEKLREIDQMKSRFFANISHEFRTPLTLIKGPLQEAEKKGDLLSNSQISISAKYVRIMRRNADRLLELVNQLLDLSKVEDGKMQLSVQQGDIAHFIRVMAMSFESLAVKKQIAFSVQVPAKPIPAWFDPDKLEKIVVNLLSNAFKFTPEEGTVRIELSSAEEDDGSVQLVVADNGIGISKEQMEHIFDRFYTFSHDHTSELNNDLGGTGLGLALTKELVELHHGKISVESNEQIGTHFSIILPIHQNSFTENEIVKGQKINPPKRSSVLVPTPASINDPAEKLSVVDSMENNEPLVLIIEDHSEVRDYISSQLEKSYRTLQAENGKRGLEIALEKLPDLIISDVMMPLMDGLELCDQLKRNEKISHIPIILLTAKAELEDRLEGLQLGADDYLAKPFDADELRIRVHNLIDQRQKLRQRFEMKTFRLKPGEIMVSSADEIFLKKVIQTIEENMEDEDFSVEELGKLVGMSRYQLHRKIKALTNVSVSVLIRTIRLERALQLLQQKAGNATEICYQVGFSSPAYFSKCFKAQFGMVPSEV